MKKIILILLVFFGFSNAKEYTVNTYTVVIDVNSTKVNGLSWDFVGGSPDIFIKVDIRKKQAKLGYSKTSVYKLFLKEGVNTSRCSIK